VKITYSIIILILIFCAVLSTIEEFPDNRDENLQIPEELQFKIDSGYLIRNINSKMQQLDSSIRNDKTEFAQVILYFAEYPSNEVTTLLEKKGVKCYLDSWIPPLESHPNGFILALIPTESFIDVISTQEIVRIASGERILQAQNNEGATTTNADDVWTLGFDGTDVEVAVLDSGLDSFYDGTDMPSTYEKKDYSAYPTLDDNVENTHGRTGHGTHVAGSVLGRGSLSSSNTGNGGGAYSGIAPDADLCFLKIEHDTNGGASSAAINGAMTDAVNVYDSDIITMSYGGWSTYHDGSDSMCQTADWCYNQGVPVFVSAGNDANDNRHYSGTIAASSTTGFIEVTHNTSSEYIGFNLVWDDGSGRNVDLDISYFDSGHNPISKYQYSFTESSRGTESRQTRTFSSQPAGTYYVKITNNSGSSQFFHLYELYGAGRSEFPSGIADPFYTCGSPAEADHVFAVGSWNTRESWTSSDGSTYWYGSGAFPENVISSFSNRGPRIDEFQKPQIAAPGAIIISLRDTDVYSSFSTSWVDNNGDTTAPHNYYIMQGTSMSCPMVAGAAALILDKYPTVTPQQIYDALQDNASTDGYTGTVPNNTWGYGKLDVLAAINDDSALPVTLSSFTVSYSKNSVVLNWLTQSETDNLGFNLYRSENENGFENSLSLNSTLISGMGTTSTPTNYSFADEYPVIEGHTYYYWLQSVSTSNELELYGPVSIEIPITGQLPTMTILESNYPNPFNPETTISFNIKENETGVLSIFNLKGERIFKKEFEAGDHQYLWNAEGLSSGIYFYKLASPTTNLTRKMILMK
jgi:subtilisin family serine protease